MPARILPPLTEIETLLRRGYTHQQIADAITEKTGYPVSRNAISSAIHRAGLAKQQHKKYADEIPWTVKKAHLLHYAARMLRLLGRRNAGLELDPIQERRLDAWLEKLRQIEAVVTYIPETEEGFWYVDGEPNEKGIPILENPPL